MHRSRLVYPMLLLALLLQASGAQAGSQVFCGSCSGSCGKSGACVQAGNLCLCSDPLGTCGAPACNSNLCAPGLTCNPPNCECGPPNTPSATPSATPTTTPGGPC